MTNSHMHYLKALNIELWEPRHSNKDAQVTPSAPDTQADWLKLQSAVAACTACGLSKTRTQTVFGVGHKKADLMIIGEAPGFYEDKQGEPFVGRAGLLLNAMLATINLTRHNVYIANILKCRPPHNRNPLPDEVALCTPYLQTQIQLVQPKLLLALGKVAAHYLLSSTDALHKLRGSIHSFGKLPLIVTYHPAYLLRNPRDKQQAYQDLQFVMTTLNTIIHSK